MDPHVYVHLRKEINERIYELSFDHGAPAQEVLEALVEMHARVIKMVEETRALGAQDKQACDHEDKEE